jgi:hypothetical protein
MASFYCSPLYIYDHQFIYLDFFQHPSRYLAASSNDDDDVVNNAHSPLYYSYSNLQLYLKSTIQINADNHEQDDNVTLFYLYICFKT